MCSQENQNVWARNWWLPTVSAIPTSLSSDVILSLLETVRFKKNDSHCVGSGSEVTRSNLHSNFKENRRGITSLLGPHKLFQDFLQYLVCTDENLCSERRMSFEQIRKAPNPNNSDPNHSSTSSTPSLAWQLGRGNRISGCTQSSFPHIEKNFGNLNRTRVLHNLRNSLASIQEEKEIMRLAKQLSAKEAEKAARFLDAIVSYKSEHDIIVWRKILKKFKLQLPEVNVRTTISINESKGFE